MEKRWDNYHQYKLATEQEIIDHADEVEWHAFSFFMNPDNFSHNFYQQFKHDLAWEVLDTTQKEDSFLKEFSEFMTY